jgi:hypothetical protein
MAGGVQVGHCLAGFTGSGWVAYGWLVATHPGEGIALEVKGADLRDVHGKLTERLADKGPWWT